jgi:predicted AAA+ superfamily ATPase
VVVACGATLAPSAICIGEFIKLLAKFETTETWSRYSTSGKGGQTKHVDAEVVIPIVKIQHDLENLVNSHLYNLGGNPSYEGDLYSECDFLLEELREKWESEPQQGSQ